MDKSEKLLLETRDLMQVDLIAGMLEEEGIPFYTKRPVGGVIHSANKLCGIRVFVAAGGYDRAKELLDAYLVNIPDNLEGPEPTEQ